MVSASKIFSKSACAVMLLMASTLYGQADHVQVRQIGDFDFGTYISAGSLLLEQDHCVSSANTANPNPPKSGETFPYQLNVDDVIADGGFYLYLNGNTAETGNRRLFIEIFHADMIAGGGVYHKLFPGVVESEVHAGQFRNCTQNGPNSRVKVQINEQDINSVISGNYSGSFSISAIGGISGMAYDPGITFNVFITIASVSEVMVSSLDGIDLGTYSGMGNISVTESFCVYSSSINGGYSITFSSLNQDANANFYLVDNTSSDAIGYSLSFIDSVTSPPGQDVGTNPIMGAGDNVSQDCGGLDNATLAVNVSEADLSSVKSGTFSDSITLMVQPE